MLYLFCNLNKTSFTPLLVLIDGNTFVTNRGLYWGMTSLSMMEMDWEICVINLEARNGESFQSLTRKVWRKTSSKLHKNKIFSESFSAIKSRLIFDEERARSSSKQQSSKCQLRNWKAISNKCQKYFFHFSDIRRSIEISKVTSSMNAFTLQNVVLRISKIPKSTWRAR